MHRQTGYRGQLPYETDFLYNGRFAYEGLGLFAMDVLGTSTLVSGCACSPTSPASLSVKVAPGRIYSLQNLDDSDWGVANATGGLAADTNADHRILKQGLLRDTTQLTFAAPGTVGQSVNYLVQAQFQTSDAGDTVLPFFNSAAPDVPWAGPGNSGGALPTYRKDSLILTTKAGAAAATGSQVTPAPDAGCVGLWVITVAQGQTTIASGNISAYGSAPFLTETLTQKISQAAGDARYVQLGTAPSYGEITAAGSGNIPIPAWAKSAEIWFTGAGGGGGTGDGGTGGPSGTYANGAYGGDTTVNGVVAKGGGGGSGGSGSGNTYPGAPGDGGTGTGLSYRGGAGTPGMWTPVGGAGNIGGSGGDSMFGGGGASLNSGAQNGLKGGGGAGGKTGNSGSYSGAGGSAGETRCITLNAAALAALSGNIPYTNGAPGAGGVAASNFNGGAGGPGYIRYRFNP